MFGENLTIAGLLEDQVRIGDVFVVGNAMLQVSEPRFPCFKLGVRLADQNILRRFQASERSGFYCRVLQEGLIEAGQAIELIQSDVSRPAIADIIRRRNQIAGL